MSNTTNMQGSPTGMHKNLILKSETMDDLGEDVKTQDLASQDAIQFEPNTESHKIKEEKSDGHSIGSDDEHFASQLESNAESHKIKEEKSDDHSDGTDDEYFEFFECEICYLSFPSNKHLEDHKKEHSFGSTTIGEADEQSTEKLSDSDEEYTPPTTASSKNLSTGSKGSEGKASTNKKKGRGKKEKFRCDFCALKFTDHKRLIEHAREHYIGNTGPPKLYRSTNRQHRKSYKKPKIKLRDQLCCDICGLPCSSDEKLVEHLKAAHGDNSNKNKKQGQEFVCEICKASFSENHQLGEHFREHFKDKSNKSNVTVKEEGKEAVSENKCVCKTCGMGFPDFKALAAHLKTHVARQTKPRKQPDGEAFICEICDAAFAKKAYLQKHIRIHLADKPKCKICGVQCSNKSNLVTHMMIHTGEKPYKCDICEVAYSKRCNLIKHQSIHTGEKAFKCPFCEAGFSNRSQLLAHVRLHTGEAPYKCELCDQSFITQPLLASHQRQHTGERPFKCPLCSAAFIQKSSLTYHMKRGIHQGEHPFKCWYCNLELSSKSRLDKHIKTHTEEKPFKCDSCHAEFSLKCTLNAHRKIHTGEKRFKCDKCDATFAKRGSLTLHLRVHTENQYKCHICDASYFQKGAFDMHMKLHSSSTFDDAIGVYEKDILRSMEAYNDSGKSDVRDHENYQDVTIKLEQGNESEHIKRQTGSDSLDYESMTNEKMYECHICDASFSGKGTLAKHMKLHSSNDFDECIGISEKDILQSMEVDMKLGSNGKMTNKNVDVTEGEYKEVDIKIEPGIQIIENSDFYDNVNHIGGEKRKYNENDIAPPHKRQKELCYSLDSSTESFERGQGLKIPIKLASPEQFDEIDGKFEKSETSKIETSAFLAENGLGMLQGQINRNHSDDFAQRNTTKTFDYNTSLVEQINSYQDNSKTVIKSEKDSIDQTTKSKDFKQKEEDLERERDNLDEEMSNQVVDLSKTSTGSKNPNKNNQANAYNELLQNLQLPYMNLATEMFEKAMINPQMMGQSSQSNIYGNQLAYMEYMQRLSSSLLSNTAVSNNCQGASGTSKNLQKESPQTETGIPGLKKE